MNAAERKIEVCKGQAGLPAADTLKAVCSNKVRAATKTSKFGNQWWRREVYHLSRDSKTTLCGRDASEWLTIGAVEIDSNCCARCAAKASS